MLKSIILDSGAYGVWSKGLKIDIDDYVRFCKKNSHIDYFVNLDVIPGQAGDPSSIRNYTAREESCKEGFRNYQRMVSKLPHEKVIPVFHIGEDPVWLERYMWEGAKYIGMGGLVGQRTSVILSWLRRNVQPLVYDSNGGLKIKMHGFGITSFSAIRGWSWESVDSSAWVRVGGMGTIYFPRVRDGQFDYSLNPLMVDVTDRPTESPFGGFFAESSGGLGFGSKADGVLHLLNLRGVVRAQLHAYLEGHRLSLGEWEVVDCPSDYKRKKNERWADKKKTKIIRVLKRGVITDNMSRKWLNMRFFQEANKALPVNRIYLAGLDTNAKIEKGMVNRLLAFSSIRELGDKGCVLYGLKD